MGPELKAPLLLTDRPWEQIEAEKSRPPVSTGPMFGNLLVQTFTLPIVVSEELWQMLTETLRRRYEQPAAPAPVLLLEGPRWWEKEREKEKLTTGAKEGHAKAMKLIGDRESQARKQIQQSYVSWSKTLREFAAKHGDASLFYEQRIAEIDEYLKQDMHTRAGKFIQRLNAVFKKHAAMDTSILKLLKDTDALSNKDMKANILHGGNGFIGANQIAGDLDADPESSKEAEDRLATLRDKLDEYLSRPSAVAKGMVLRARGPNGLFALPRAALAGRATGKLYRTEAKAAGTLARIGDIHYLITNARLRANRDGPNPAYWHAHVGGDYQDNMIVRKLDNAIMGFVDGHISGKNEDRDNANKAKTIEARVTTAPGALIEILVIDGDLYELV